MADGGGGGGGAFDSFQGFIDQVARPAAETLATGGLNQTDEGKKWKSEGDKFVKSVTGETARETAADESRKARGEQAKREAQITEQEMKSTNQSKFATARNRQKSLSGGGRSSTILTSPLGAPSTATGSSGKTLLGS